MPHLPEPSTQRPPLRTIIDRIEALRPSRMAALIFGLLLLMIVLSALPSLRAPFFWDDYHLIRVHTPAQLANVWTGSWDADGIETPGFRPLTAYFDHVRALAFGDSVVAHRVFLLVLFSVFLTLSGLLAWEFFDASVWQMLLGAALAFFHVASVDHYVWITDGIYLASGILVVAAIASFLNALRLGRAVWLLVSFISTGLALLTREDTLVLFPLVVWFGACFVLARGQDIRRLVLSRRSLALFGGVMLVGLGLFWFWRGAVVPKLLPLQLAPAGYVWALDQLVHNVGDYGMLINPWPPYGGLIAIWNMWLICLALAALFLLKSAARLQILLWGGAALLAALPNFVVARANLLLLPVMFWGMLVAAVLAGFWRQASGPAFRLGAALAILFALAAPAYGSNLVQQEQRSNSLLWICANTDAIYGPRHTPSIPAARRDLARIELVSYGISRPADFASRWPTLIQDARQAGRFGPSDAGLPFIPHFDFQPMFQIRWFCAADLGQQAASRGTP